MPESSATVKRRPTCLPNAPLAASAWTRGRLGVVGRLRGAGVLRLRGQPLGQPVVVRRDVGERRRQAVAASQKMPPKLTTPARTGWPVASRTISGPPLSPEQEYALAKPPAQLMAPPSHWSAARKAHIQSGWNGTSATCRRVA